MRTVRSTSILAVVFLALVACGGDGDGGSAGNPCIEDPEGDACLACSEKANDCYDAGVCEAELDRGLACAEEECPPDVFDTREKGKACLKANCSTEVWALRTCMDSSCPGGNVCIGFD